MNNEQKNYQGIVELTSIINDVRKQVVLQENIVTTFPFRALQNIGNINSANMAVIDTDTLSKDSPDIGSLGGMLVSGIVKRLASSVISRTETPLTERVERNRERDVVARFDANGSVQTIDSVCLLDGTSQINAYTKLDAPYSQQAAESIEIRYRVIMVIDPAVSFNTARFWQQRFNDKTTISTEKMCGVLPTDGVLEIDDIYCRGISKFDPARDTVNLGNIIRTLCYQKTNIPSGSNLNFSGLRLIEGLSVIPGLPVGNIFNHGKDSQEWYEDLSNLADGKGAVLSGAGHTPQFIDGNKADMNTVHMTKTGEIGTAKYTFSNRRLGTYFPDNVAYLDWGLLINKIVYVKGEKVEITKADTGFYGIDDTHLLVFNTDQIAVQHIVDMKIKVFNAVTNPELTGITKMTSFDITSAGVVFVSNGTMLMMIEDITTDTPTFTIIDDVNFNNESPHCVSVSDTHLFVATDSKIHQADLTANNWSVKSTLPTIFNTNPPTDLIVNADESQGFVGYVSSSRWWDIAGDNYTAVSVNAKDMFYSENHKLWSYSTGNRIYKFGTNIYQNGNRIVIDYPDVLITANSGSLRLLNGVAQPTMLNQFGGSSHGSLNSKTSTTQILGNNRSSDSTVKALYLSPTSLSSGSYNPRIKSLDLLARTKDYRFNTNSSAFEEGYEAPVNVSSGSDTTSVVREGFAPDSYAFQGWQSLDISENIKFDLSTGFSIAVGVNHVDKFSHTYQGDRQVLAQIALTDDTGIELVYRSSAGNIEIKEYLSNGTNQITNIATVGATGINARMVLTIGGGEAKVYRDGNLLGSRTLTNSINVDNTAGSVKAYVGLAVQHLHVTGFYKEDGMTGVLDNLVIYNKALTLTEVGQDNTNGVTTTTSLVVSRALLTEEIGESKTLTASETMPSGINLDFVNTTGTGDSFVEGDYYNYALIENGVLKDNVTEFTINAKSPFMPLREVTLSGTVDNTVRSIVEPIIPNVVDEQLCTGFVNADTFNIDTELFNNNVTGEFVRLHNTTQTFKYNGVNFVSNTDKGSLTTVAGQLQYDGVDVTAIAGLVSLNGSRGYLQDMQVANNLPARVHRLGGTVSTVKKGAYAPDFQMFESVYNTNVKVTVDGVDRTVVINNDITANVAAGTVNLSTDRSLIKFGSADAGKAYSVTNLFATVRGFYAN